MVDTGVPLVTADFSREGRSALAQRDEYRAVGPLALVPMRSEEGIIGTLCVARLKASGGTAFTAAEARLLEGIAEVAGTAIRRASLYQSLQDAYVQMVIALAHAIETRDAYTASHSARMVALATRVARELGCSAQDIEDVRWAARLHDIGKIGVSDAVLRKPTILTAKGWAVMEQHPCSEKTFSTPSNGCVGRPSSSGITRNGGTGPATRTNCGARRFPSAPASWPWWTPTER